MFVSPERVAGSQLSFVDNIKSLGAYIDADPSFDAQVNTVCKTCNYHIRALRHIWNNLPMNVSKTVACSIAGSRLDYCNALLYGISDRNIQKVQRVQNDLACFVLKAPRQTPTDQMLAILHWLPIDHRIRYKMAVLAYKSVRTVQPAYLSDGLCIIT